MARRKKQSEPLRQSISVSFTRREAAAIRRLGNKYGSASDQVRKCLDKKKLQQLIDEAEAIEAQSGQQQPASTTV